MIKRFRLGLVALALTGSTLSAVTIGQIDSFDNGTTMGWGIGDGGSPNPPMNVSGGGPGGAGDAYLQLKAVGNGGPGSKMVAINDAQWSGDYVAAGIKFILMDVNNFGPEDLYLRLLFEAFPSAGGPPSDLALSANAIVVPASSGWMSIVFPVLPDNLISGGRGTILGALTGTDAVRLFHNPVAAFPGPPNGIPAVNATLGVDNITAAVPEPGSLSLVLAGGIAGSLLRRRRR